MERNNSYGKDFFEKFKKNIANKSDIVDKYITPKPWTQTMLGDTPNRSKKKRPENINNAGGVIGQTIKEVFDNKIFIDREYYKIDMIGWTQHKTEIESDCEKSNLKPYCWNLKVAVEHENDSSEWLDEVCKLSFIKCPLRVVIGYGNENFDKKIEIVKDILTKNDAFSDDKQEFLIILGKTKKELLGKTKKELLGKTKKELSKNPTAEEIAKGYGYAIITNKGIVERCPQTSPSPMI